LTDALAAPKRSWSAGGPPQPFVQVLLLANPQKYLDAARALLAAFVETEQFFAAGDVTFTTARVFLGQGADAIPVIGTPLSGAPPIDKVLEIVRSRAKGAFKRTVDQQQLAAVIRDLLDLSLDRHLQIVADFEITPPPEWRYILWDEVENGSVIAIPPMDPEYWQVQDENRIATIKHRVRTSCVAALGEWLGLERCQNPTCLLFENVDSVTRLDLMRRLGREHSEAPRLHGRGYDPRPKNPSDVQVLEERSGGGGGGIFRLQRLMKPLSMWEDPEIDLEDLK
jgi:hypothetical protein